jgi:hypothetical protein
LVLAVFECAPAGADTLNLGADREWLCQRAVGVALERLFEHAVAPPLAVCEQRLSGRAAMTRHDLAQSRGDRVDTVAPAVHEA